jgi:ABC-type amino acid transport substrate-binding protein
MGPNLRGVLSVLSVVVACDAIAQSAPLSVCIAEDNEPLSYVHEGKPKGFDVRIAQAIADEMGRPLRIVPFETEYERESTLAREVDALLSSQVCELASGFPLLREDFRRADRLGAHPGFSWRQALSRAPVRPVAADVAQSPLPGHGAGGGVAARSGAAGHAPVRP